MKTVSETWRRACLPLTLVAILWGGSTPGLAAEQSLKDAIKAAKEGKVAYLMREKLRYSQLMLEGMMTGNYEIVGEAAEALDSISQETTWQSLRTEGFQRYAKSFQNAAIDLREASAKRNLADVSLPYIRMTLSCMECHELVRRPLKEGGGK